MIHIVRDTPRSVASDALRMFDDEIRLCFALCAAIEFPNDVWYQTQLGLMHGGLGHCTFSRHAAATFIASLTSSDFGSADKKFTFSMQGQCPTARSPFPNHYMYSRIFSHYRRSCRGRS